MFKKKSNFLLLLIIIAAFLLRLMPFGFPNFTNDEARVAFRGYLLSKSGTDELGRRLPLIFNSSTDYQLPVTSYITAIGPAIFGKSDFAVRIPFVLMGVLIVFLSYKTAGVFRADNQFRLLAAFLVALSPGFIFLSKIPNEFIILTFLIFLLFYILTKEKINTSLAGFIILLSFFTSKIAWFIMPFFVIFILLFFQRKTAKNTKIFLTLFCLLILIASMIIFLKIPQGGRSLLENNFSLFLDKGITNNIERFRTQGLENGASPLIEKILFNKTQFIIAGFLNLFSSLQPSIFFSQFDKSGEYGFFNMGAWPKIALIPFLTGLIFWVKKEYKNKLIIFVLLLMSIPLFFMYPSSSKGVLAVILPFMAFIIAEGLSKFNGKLRNIILGLIVFEVIVNLFYIFPQEVNSNTMRLSWIKAVVVDAYNSSKTQKVAFSDNITNDMVSFFEWYTPVEKVGKTFDLDFPYKFQHSEISKIRWINLNDEFYNCGADRPAEIYATKRDFFNIQKWLNPKLDEKDIQKVYKDLLGNERVYRLPATICIK